jgi:allophanate hydrolase
MVALETQPPKPGVYRSENGAELVAERWLLPEAALGRFLAALPEPMLLGSVLLADGTRAVGFACDAVAAAAGRDITSHGDWIAATAAESTGSESPGQNAHDSLRDSLLTGFTRGRHANTTRR